MPHVVKSQKKNMSREALVQVQNELLDENQKLKQTVQTQAKKISALAEEIEQLKSMHMNCVAELHQLEKEVEKKRVVEDTSDDVAISKYWQDCIEKYGEVQGKFMKKKWEQLRRETSFTDFMFNPQDPTKVKSVGDDLLDTYLMLPFCIWAPKRQGATSIPCPKCSKECTPLRLAPFREVADFDGTILYTCEVYQCLDRDSCGSVVSGDDDKVMKTLPKTIQAMFPILKTRQLGVTKRLADFILTASATALSVTSVHAVLKELYGCHYQRRCIRYMSHLAGVKDSWLEKYRRMQAFRLPSPSPPTLFLPPSPDHIADIQLGLLTERAETYDDYMASLDSSIICLDHTFKVAKALLYRSSDGIERPFRSQFGAVNEYGEIVSIVCTRNEQFSTLQNCLTDLAQRGPMSVQFAYVDNCCTVRQQLQKYLPDCTILLDMWHWLQRFMRCIPVATRDPDYSSFIQALKFAMFDDLQQATKTPRVRRRASFLPQRC